MVSFFGLRIGGERKKKTDKNEKSDKAAAGTAAAAAPQKCQTFDQAVMRESKAAGKDGEEAGADAARPSSSRSHKVRKRRPTDTPFDFDNTLAAIGLPQPHKFADSSYPSLRTHSSNPNLVSEWKNGSTPDLVTPSRPVIEQVTQPTSSSREKPQLHSIDVPAAREAAARETAREAASPKASLKASPIFVASPQSMTSGTLKSPLGNMELTLDLPKEGAALFAEGEDVLKPPEPLRIIKKSPSDSQLGPPPNPPPAGKPPSPPQSIRTDDQDHRSGGGGGNHHLPTAAKRANTAPQPRSQSQPRPEERPDQRRRASSTTSSTTSHRIESADLDNEFRELSEELNYGPKSMPSPPASLRLVSMGRNDGGDDDADADADPGDDTLLFFEGLGAPIIRTVEAKRDTLSSMSVYSERRTSVETLVEKTAALGIGSGSGSESEPQQPPPRSSARAARPAALNLNPNNISINNAAGNGPRSAPFPVNRPPWTPTLGQSPLAYAAANRAPSAAGSSRLVPLRLSRDSFEFDLTSPHSPESPVIPLSGPLASSTGITHVSSPAGSVQARKTTPTPSPAPAIISPVRRCHTDAEVRVEVTHKSEDGLGDENGNEDPDERMRNFRFPDFSSLPASTATSPVREKFPALGLGRPSPLQKLQEQLRQQHQQQEAGDILNNNSTTTTTKTPAAPAPAPAPTPTPAPKAPATRRPPSISSPPPHNPTQNSTPTPNSAHSTTSPFTPVEPFPAFSPLKRVATAPNDRLSNWPLPSPTMAKMATVTRTGTAPTPSATTGGAGGSVFELVDPLDPLDFELQPPRMPAALAESKTSRVRSFSRPWTPTNEPLKFEITNPSNPAAASPVIRTTQTVTSPPLQQASSAMSSPRSLNGGRTRSRSRGQAPPPRSPPPVAASAAAAAAAAAGAGAGAGTGVDRGLRNPGIVGDDFGGGFI